MIDLNNLNDEYIEKLQKEYQDKYFERLAYMPEAREIFLDIQRGDNDA